VTSADFHSRSAASAVVYDGLTVQGRVVRTIVGGTTVFRDGQIVGSAGAFVAPEGIMVPDGGRRRA
ncbi:MAG: hypothetical protein ABIR11_00335, partial [Candidatus Limnocylindrales bacterium]